MGRLRAAPRLRPVYRCQATGRIHILPFSEHRAHYLSILRSFVPDEGRTEGHSMANSTTDGVTATDQAGARPAQSHAKVIRAAILGTVVEYYDFGIYGYMAT